MTFQNDLYDLKFGFELDLRNRPMFVTRQPSLLSSKILEITQRKLQHNSYSIKWELTLYLFTFWLKYNYMKNFDAAFF